MKFIVAIFLTALLSYILPIFAPWWVIGIISFFVALAIPQKTRFSFLSAALALFLLWGIQALIIDFRNEHILARKIAGLIIHRNSAPALIVLTACIGACVAGLAAVSGSLLRKIISDR